FDPFTVRVNGPLLTMTESGEIDVIDGAGLLTGNVNPADVVPGAGLATVTFRFAAVVRSVAGMAAVNWPGPLNVVDRADPFTLTVEPFVPSTNPVPLTTRLMPALPPVPTRVFGGTSVVIVGVLLATTFRFTWFEVWLLLGLTTLIPSTDTLPRSVL